jgi:hypothetical protein
LERWRAEVPPLVRDSPSTIARAHDQHGGAEWTEQADPGWSRALCWTMPGQRRCAMRRRWASDTHIGVARSVFAQYMDDLAEFLRGEGAMAWAMS